MYTSYLLVGIAARAAVAGATDALGYFTDFSSISKHNFDFGRHYAVLNLDLTSGLVGSMNKTTQGQKFIKSTATWINAVHAQDPAPLSIFTRVYISNPKAPEVKPGSSFAKIISSLGDTTESSPSTQVYAEFKVKEGHDVVLQKARYYGGFGNELEAILSSQSIDTVILSGVRSSGVVLNTAYQLVNLDYNVYVIVDNTIESPPNAPRIDRAIKEGILPKLPVNVITLSQALAALKRSGPAIY